MRSVLTQVCLRSRAAWFAARYAWSASASASSESPNLAAGTLLAGPGAFGIAATGHGALLRRWWRAHRVRDVGPPPAVRAGVVDLKLFELLERRRSAATAGSPTCGSAGVASPAMKVW
jgi:hypothetical protein